jgi:hypothetical protein
MSAGYEGGSRPYGNHLAHAKPTAQLYCTQNGPGFARSVAGSVSRGPKRVLKKASVAGDGARSGWHVSYTGK